MSQQTDRRNFLKRSLMATAGATAAVSFEENNLLAQQADETLVTAASKEAFKQTKLEELKGQVPHTAIKGMPLSRVILGGNLIGGWAHARDLIYVSRLVQAYHTKDKIFQTLWLAEQAGINTLLTNPKLCEVINEYWDKGIGKIQFISDCGGSNILDGVKRSIDFGASACYLHGGIADGLVQKQQFDLMGQALDIIRSHNLPCGIGGHKLETVKGSVEAGLKPDFWMKTLHKHSYWSAKHPEHKDNMYCYDPKETAAYMKGLEQPWIAFKTLAAGAIHPKDAFQWVFEQGADFLCVGMYDFQIVDDVNLALDVLGNGIKRDRPWRA